MALFTQPRPRRRTALVVLGVWVWALLVGIANACAPGDRDSSHPGSDHHTTNAGHDHAAHASAGAEQARGAEASPPLNQACQKFCDDEATTDVKHDKAFEVVPVASSATTVVWWLPASAAQPLQARLDTAPPPEAPLTFRFMRLTI